MNEKLNYWEDEYSKNAIPLYPSQFAAFVASELYDDETQIIDVGCGNGRDSIFFAQLGRHVIGIDGSSVVVDTNNKRFQKQSKSVHFIEQNMNDEDVIDYELPENSTIYSRFFIHAIDENAENNFLRMAQNNMQTGQRLFLEFRTEQDANLVKVAKEHYRRYVNNEAFIANLEKHDYIVNYIVEGFGYAKYKTEDAHVCRIICQKK